MSKRVLLVEDSPVAREKVAGILSDLGCEVITAEDGVEGLQTATRNVGKLDLIILDIQMPKADGLTLLRYLRKVPGLAGTTVIMLTTQADKETVKTALSQGARDFLRKDATIAQITERLQFHLQEGEADETAVPVGTTGTAANTGEREEQVRDLLMGSVRPVRIEGPCVLCHVPEKEVAEFVHEHGTRQLELYLGIAKGVAELNQRFPHLRASYMIETISSEVSKHLKQSEQIRWVLLLGRRPEGLSTARVGGMAGLFENRTVHMICDPIASLADRDQGSVTRMGAQLIEQEDFNRGGALKLLEEHLLPPARNVGSVRLRDLVTGTGVPPKRGQTVRLHYSAVRDDGEIVTHTFSDGEPADIAFDDERLPEAIWLALTEIGRGGKALASLKDVGPEEPVHFMLEVVDVTDL